eukprot:1156452-Pelagomonas_calceolata.AAC.2
MKQQKLWVSYTDTYSTSEKAIRKQKIPTCCAHQHISSEPSCVMHWLRKIMLAIPLDYETHFTAGWSPYARDRVFGANTDMFGTKFTGFSFFHPAHDDKFIYYQVMRALSSVANTDILTVAFMLLPSQMGWTKKGYMRWFSCYPEHATVLAKFPSESLTFQTTQVHLPLTPTENNMKHMRLIVIWSNERLFQNDPYWLEGLQHEIPRGMWCHRSSRQLADRQSTFLSFKTPSTWLKRIALLHHDTYNLFEVCVQQKNVTPNIQFYMQPL